MLNRNIVLIYILIRPFLAAMYDIRPLPGFRMTDLAGAGFVLISIMIFMRNETKTKVVLGSNVKLLMSWVVFSSLLHVIIYDLSLYVVFKDVFKILNGVVAFFLYPIVFRSEKDIKLLWVIYLVSTIFPAGQAILQYVGVLDLNKTVLTSGVVMYEGVYSNIGYYALTSIIGTVTIIGMTGIVKKRGIKQFLFILFVGFAFVGTMTVSRNVFVNIVIIFVIYLLSVFRYGKALTSIVPVLLLAAVVTMSLFQGQYEDIIERSQYEFEVLEGERDVGQGLHGRVERWQEGIDVFVEQYTVIENVIGTNIYIGPHGDYFFWLFYFGIIGVLLYLVFVARMTIKVITSSGVDDFSAVFKFMAVASLLVWMSTALVTNPSMIPDYGYFILGNVSIYLTHYSKRTDYGITTAELQ